MLPPTRGLLGSLRVHHCRRTSRAYAMPQGYFERINLRRPSLTVLKVPSFIRRRTDALLMPVLSQNSAIESVALVNGTMRFSRGRRGLGSIWRLPKIAWLS
jgi:hypothetical protein